MSSLCLQKNDDMEHLGLKSFAMPRVDGFSIPHFLTLVAALILWVVATSYSRRWVVEGTHSKFDFDPGLRQATGTIARYLMLAL